MENAIPFLCAKDKVFWDIIDLYGTPNVVVRPQGFATLCKIIFEQQVSLESAKATYDKLERMIVDFTPENVIRCSADELRHCGLSRQKASYIFALAEAIINKDIDLNSFSQKSPEEVRRELIKIKGVGNWTIDVYLMFSLQSPDVIPLGDIGIIATIKELWQVTDKDSIINLTNQWAPHRTTASFFLWHYYLKKRGRVIHP